MRQIEREVHDSSFFHVGFKVVFCTLDKGMFLRKEFDMCVFTVLV